MTLADQVAEALREVERAVRRHHSGDEESFNRCPNCGTMRAAIARYGDLCVKMGRADLEEARVWAETFSGGHTPPWSKDAAYLGVCKGGCQCQNDE